MIPSIKYCLYTSGKNGDEVESDFIYFQGSRSLYFINFGSFTGGFFLEDLGFGYHRETLLDFPKYDLSKKVKRYGMTISSLTLMGQEVFREASQTNKCVDTWI